MEHIENRKKLIFLCNKFKLPLNVKSTSIKIYNKIMKQIKINNEDFILTILGVSAKCEELHDLPIPMNPIRNESVIHKALNFDYDIPSTYLKMSSILVNIQVEGLGNYNDRFIEGCLLMDKLLIYDNDEYTDLEKAVTALNLPDHVVEKMCDIERIKSCSKLIN